MDGPKELSVEWSQEAKFSVMDLWWLFIVIIIVVVVIVAALLFKRKSGKEEEEITEEGASDEEADIEEAEEAGKHTLFRVDLFPPIILGLSIQAILS